MKLHTRSDKGEDLLFPTIYFPQVTLHLKSVCCLLKNQFIYDLYVPSKSMIFFYVTINFLSSNYPVGPKNKRFTPLEWSFPNSESTGVPLDDYNIGQDRRKRRGKVKRGHLRRTRRKDGLQSKGHSTRPLPLRVCSLYTSFTKSSLDISSSPLP